MLKTIRFYGDLAEKYGESFNLAVETPAEAVRALILQIRGLEADIRKGEFVCVRGDFETGVECDELHLHLHLGRLNEFHVIPAAVGRKGGVGKILAGIALIAATVITAGAALAAAGLYGFAATATTLGLSTALTAGLGGFGLIASGIGALLILSGVSMLLAPHPKLDDFKEVDQKEGFLFSGAANTAIQGNACPLVFGRIRAGSVVVSAGITTERIGAAAIDYSSTGGIVDYTIMEIYHLP